MIRWFRKYQIKSKCKTGKLPPFICEYVRVCEQIPSALPIEEATFLVLDTETTGLNPQKDKIISLAGVIVQGSTIHFANSFEALVFQENIGNKTTSPIHQILAQELSKAPTEREVLEKWLDFSKGMVLVAHHAHFDAAIIEHHLQKNFQIPLFNPVIDTFQLAMRLDKASVETYATKKNNYHLDALCERFDIQVAERHTAMGDTLATAELFLYLKAQLKQRGNYSLKDFLSF